MRKEKDLELTYREYLTHFSEIHNVAKIDNEYEKTYLFIKDFIKRYLPKDLNSSFLDLGCGLGHAIYSFTKLGYKNVVGIDINSENVEFCKSKKFNVKKSSISKFLKNSKTDFHVIYAFDVIEHFYKDEAINLISLAKLRLKKNGLLVLILPNANNLSNFRLRYMDITHEVFYTPESIIQLLRSNGFENVKIDGLRHFSVSDRNKLWALAKGLLALPTYKLSEFLLRLFYLSMGITNVRILTPKMLVIARS